MSPFKKIYYVLRHLGPRVVWTRTRLRVEQSIGLTCRRFEPAPWASIDLSTITKSGTPTDPTSYTEFKRRQARLFLFPLGQPYEVPVAVRDAASERRPTLSQRMKLLAEDRCVYFLHTPSPEPIDWYKNPFSRTRGEAERTWCAIPDFDPAQGDPRTLWEPSRAAWAIDLARARCHGLSLPAGRLLWRWLESWMAACPPFKGFQWKCGQECSVRFIAIVLAFWSLADDPATTPDRWVQFARLAWATGYRVSRHIHYAISQNNNHALSEACGLLLVSHLFPELSESRRWNATGRRVLSQALRRQVYDDGSYIQHSVNYHRVMLHVSMFALRVAELADEPFERDLYDRLRRSGCFLFQMMDPETGRAPDYGNNDGACVLPLNECDFMDFRPVVQATHYMATRERLLPPGPWDEDVHWLFGPDVLGTTRSTPSTAPGSQRPRPTSAAFRKGGYYTLRRSTSWAMIRCHTYRDRPGQCDPLHLDLWWRGVNLLRDCGTFQYYVPNRDDMERYFACLLSHNTVVIDSASPTERVSRFLWFPWPRARLRHYQVSGDDVQWLECERYDYDRAPWAILHRRTVVSLTGDIWVIVDDVLGKGEHSATLLWHMVDVPYAIDDARSGVVLDTPKGRVCIAAAAHPSTFKTLEVVRGRDEPGNIQGFASPYYGERQPIPTLEATVTGPLPQRLLTTISPGEGASARFVRERDGVQEWIIGGNGESCRLDLAAPKRGAPTMFLRHETIES